MTSQTLAARPPYSRVAFFALLGVIASVVALNAGSALRALAAEPPPPPGLEAPVVAFEPPPPAFVFDTPLPGREVNSPFGLRQLPWEENGRLHEGVDIAAPVGSPVRAATDGIVVRSGVSESYGRYVEMAHKDGFRTMYAHLGAAARDVKPGLYARRGQTIAYVGNSGHSTGAHLHFELRRQGKALNPAFFLGRSFAEAEDLPLRAAGRVSRKVRIATVSAWPEGLKATRTKGERMRARVAVSDS
ncbi:MAG: M23 family metallopeptidase [bacterium]|nr:M23 family metallopeptidase [bacterium]